MLQSCVVSAYSRPSAKERALDFIYGEDLGAVSPEHVMPLLLLGQDE